MSFIDVGFYVQNIFFLVDDSCDGNFYVSIIFLGSFFGIAKYLEENFRACLVGLSLSFIFFG